MTPHSTPRPKQLDLLRDSPQREAERNRICAEVALIDPHWPPAKRRERHDYYMGLARASEQHIAPPPALGGAGD